MVLNDGGISFLCLTQIFFAIPYVLFSSFAGYLADRYSKPKGIQIIKFIEIIVMSLGAYFLVQGNPVALLIVLFLMGTQSAFFSPFKYGVVPEILGLGELSRGNGYLEFWSFFAIILGTVIATVLKVNAGASYLLPAIAVFVIATAGFIISLNVTSKFVGSGEGLEFTWNPWLETRRALQVVLKKKTLTFVFFCIAFFWFAGSYIQISIFLYVGNYASAENFDVYSGLMFAALAVGIGVGSIVSGISSGEKIELGLVPLGVLGIAISTMLLAILEPSLSVSMILGFVIGVCSGLFIVPVDSYLQDGSPEDERGRIIAASNVISFLAVIAGACCMWLLVESLSLTASSLFLFISLSAISFLIFIGFKQPILFLRAINWVLIHTFYRLKVQGLSNIPHRGGALIVCNHVTYADACLIFSAVGRPVRFLMHKAIYEYWLIKPFAKIVGAIPIDADGNPKETMRSLKHARELIASGELVCIFAEGGISRLGVVLGFQKGAERIMKGLEEPIIPACLDQLWGSMFSFSGGKVLKKRPKELPYRVTLAFGEALPADSDAPKLRNSVIDLSSALFSARKFPYKSLEEGFLCSARKSLFRPCIEDSSGAKLNYFQTLAASLSLAKLIKSQTEAKYVGLCFPASVCGAFTNLACLFSGKIPVNLNFTVSDEAIESAIEQCEITEVITSKALSDKLAPALSKRAIYIEDLLGDSSKTYGVFSSVLALFLPRILTRNFILPKRKSENEIATIIFSSGSTGLPKGVMLSHRNINSNLQSLYEVFQINRKDRLLGVLPFFHVFGFTGTLFLPLLSGMKAVYHGNPLDGAKIGELCEEHQTSVFMTTPTFLTSYLRRVKPEQFASLRYVIVGAEKLSIRLRDKFTEKFGVMPLEGYGASELSPVAVMNLPDYKNKGLKQSGHKGGTVGRAVPGVSVRIVNPDDMSQELEVSEDGLMLIKGPNVMEGYLNDPQKTAEVLKSGWYVTGDIANIDKDGFVTITDRLSRFSKLGGEMVPHIRVEDAILEASSIENLSCAVVGVKDEKKGEKLIVLYDQELDVSAVVKKMADAGLPNLWISKKDNFFQVSEIPKLASGKLDLKLTREKANSFNAASDRS